MPPRISLGGIFYAMPIDDFRISRTSFSGCGHKTMLRQAANDLMFRINDVALHANTTLVFAL